MTQSTEKPIASCEVVKTGFVHKKGGKINCKRAKIPMMERIVSKVSKEEKTGCWVFNGNRQAYGYGVISKGKGQGNTDLVHRMMWRLINGEIPDGMVICHKCDNPPCCNPDHLFIGTHADNISDKMSKNRQHRPIGVINPRTHLIESDVIYIRKSKDKLKNLAKKFRVAVPTIKGIRGRKNWKHVE